MAECVLCDALAEKPSDEKLVNECLSLLDNHSTARLLSSFFGIKLDEKQVYAHKKHSNDWSPLREEMGDLNWSKVQDVAKFVVLDGIHAILMHPGRTSQYATLQGLKTILDAQELEQQSNAVTTYKVIEDVKAIVIRETEDEPEVRARIAQQLDGVINRCLEAHI